jgi:glycosyltransferase involved in cell wall biosynthesis
MQLDLVSASSVSGCPTVSVVIPAYNAERTIDRALVSVWRQNWPIEEVIVVDDASRDGTAKAVLWHARPKLRLIQLEANRGECGAMNVAIAAAKGDLIAFLDADDEWLDGKLARQVPIMGQRPDLSFVSCRFETPLPGGGFYVFGAEPAASGADAWRALLRRSQTGKPCVVARRRAIEAAGGFDEDLRVAGDQDMWIRLALLGPAEFLPDVLVRVYATPGSLTHSYATRQREFALPMIERHLTALAHKIEERERRRILAERYTQCGRDCYACGGLRDGARLLARAILLGNEPVANLWYLFTAAPPIRRLKRLMGLQQSRDG